MLPRMPYSCAGYLPATAGRITPAPITATTRTAIMTTVTPSIAISAAQTGLVYTSLTGPRAPIPGAYAIRPRYGAAETASSTATARRDNEVRGSMGDGNGGPLAQPSAGASGGSRVGSGFEPHAVYMPQACRLCCRPTIYLTCSGLSDHATVHHGHWYSAKGMNMCPSLKQI